MLNSDQVPNEVELPQVIQVGSSDHVGHSKAYSLPVLIASASQYIHDTPDIYEPDVIAELVAQEIASSYPDLTNEAFNARVGGRVLGLVQSTAIRKSPIMLLSPSGEVGQLLNQLLDLAIPSSPGRVKLRGPVEAGDDGFFRVAFGARAGTLLVLSRRSLDVMDLESEASLPRVSNIMTLSEKSQLFTSIDKSVALRGAAFTCVATTREVIWIDEHQVGPPIFRWIHDYGANKVKDLEITVYSTNLDDSDNGPSSWETIILSSPSSDLTEALRVTTWPAVTVATKPWLIHGLTPQGSPLRDLIVLPLPGSPLVALGKNGSMTAARMFPSTASPYNGFNVATRLDNPSIPATARLPAPYQEEDDSDDNDGLLPGSWIEKADTRCKVLQGRWAWSEINEPTKPEAVLDLVDFQKYIREFEAPPEHMLTAGELARGLNLDSAPATRSPLLPKLGDVSRDTLSKLNDIDYAGTFHSVWAAHSGTGVRDATDELMLIRPPFQKQAYHEESLRLLADLSLSRIVLSMDNVVQRAVERATPDDLFAEAAGQLSLQERRPDPPEFGVLKPKRPLSSAAGLDFHDVNQFLQQWHTGNDPHAFTWSMPQTWSSHSSQAPVSQQQRRPIRPLPSVRAPQLLPASVAPVLLPQPPMESTFFRTTGVPPVALHSSPPRPLPVSQPSASQASFDPYPQTQTERGPFGDRPEAVARTARKKATKKRLGGF
ncbi:uncharacterized protein LOC62_04G006322 [Vanrija pseudolonga]|uniref:RRN6 K-rich C-terminal domain-containing protein n=1 Tax=Vanrija pseudolonga TaxID=143232 RepID=A0AAF0YFZ6_9TREE|nr:hypothetical protein LOC62_04G006322 [Vanrija pseudolonga]